MTLVALRIFVLGVAVSTAAAWIPQDWRRAAAAAFTAATVVTTSPLVGHAIDFSGQYSDPNHPHCLREIVVVDRTTVQVKGTDGNPGCSPVDGSGGTPWELTGKINGDSILVDFSPKGGPKDLMGVYDGATAPESIKWPDGNSWTLKETRSGIDLSSDPLM